MVVMGRATRVSSVLFFFIFEYSLLVEYFVQPCISLAQCRNYGTICVSRSIKECTLLKSHKIILKTHKEKYKDEPRLSCLVTLEKGIK